MSIVTYTPPCVGPSDFFALGASGFICDISDALEFESEERCSVPHAEPPEPEPEQETESEPQRMPSLDLRVFGDRPVVVFDTETTGISRPCVIQLAFVLIDGGKIVNEYNKLLRLPCGVTIDKQAQAVHGISSRDLTQHGVDASHELRNFHELCTHVFSRGGRVVAHNAQFDARALTFTSSIHGGTPLIWNATDCFCTMKESKSRSTLKTKRGHQKAFKNEELYTHFFFQPPRWAKLHDALDDVRVTLCSYQRGVFLKWF